MQNITVLLFFLQDMYLNIEFFKEKNKSSIVFSLDQVKLHENYTERRRYSSTDSKVSLDLSIQKSCSSEMEGETCNDPGELKACSKVCLCLDLRHIQCFQLIVASPVMLY